MGPRARLAMGLGLMLLAAACGAVPAHTPVAAKASATPILAAPTSPATSAAPASPANQTCTAITIKSSRPSTITAGDVVTITAKAGGCQAPDYRFVLLDQTGGTTVMRDWAPDPAWTWNSGSTLSGQLAVRADARAHGGTSYVPDVSAYLQFVVRGTAAAAVQTCRLPVSGVLPGSGGFVHMPGGAFEADATSNVPLRGQADQSRLRRGYTYDPVHGHWLPVPRDWVMPDFSSYVYIGTEYPHVSNMPALHVVNLTSGTDSLWPQGDQLYGYPIALRPDGVYGAPGPEIITMVDPTGAVAVVDQGHYGLFGVVTPTAIWATGWTTTSGGTYALTDVKRIDPKTQAATTWFHLEGLTALPIGIDGSGSPIVAAGTQLPSGQISATQVWIVPQPSVGSTPQGRLIYSDKNHPLVIQGAPIVSAGAIWIETDQGLWVDDNTTSTMRLVSSFSGYIAGGCA